MLTASSYSLTPKPRITILVDAAAEADFTLMDNTDGEAEMLRVDPVDRWSHGRLFTIKPSPNGRRWCYRRELYHPLDSIITIALNTSVIIYSMCFMLVVDRPVASLPIRARCNSMPANHVLAEDTDNSTSNGQSVCVICYVICFLF